MDYVSYVEDSFESIPEHGKILFFMILSRNNVAFLNGSGFLKRILIVF